MAGRELPVILTGGHHFKFPEILLHLQKNN
jgi:hypothetical protein